MGENYALSNNFPKHHAEVLMKELLLVPSSFQFRLSVIKID
jgi:hypothetical protein